MTDQFKELTKFQLQLESQCQYLNAFVLFFCDFRIILEQGQGNQCWTIWEKFEGPVLQSSIMRTKSSQNYEKCTQKYPPKKPKSAQKFPTKLRSTQKYQEVPRSTKKYQEVAEK